MADPGGPSPGGPNLPTLGEPLPTEPSPGVCDGAGGMENRHD